MQKQNQLKSILMELGFEDYKPTASLLKKLGITRLRFFQIFENTGKNEITVTEKENIENWLAEILNKPVSQINFMVPGPQELLDLQLTSKRF
ncbi:hypothetical protein [Adhaeribacter pallidiroseus]|nr:hypothetical protein [Adhaeribacter pallidiroseus]